MEQQTVDAIGETDTFEAAESAVAQWQKQAIDLDELQSRIAEWRTELDMTNREQEEILADRGLNENQASKKLIEARGRSEIKQARLQIFLGELAELEGQLGQAGEAVEQQLESLAKQLIKKRERSALALLEHVCDDDEHARHRCAGFTWNFRSVSEVYPLRQLPCSNPSQAREKLERLRALWRDEPLSKLLEVCEQL